MRAGISPSNIFALDGRTAVCGRQIVLGLAVAICGQEPGVK